MGEEIFRRKEDLLREVGAEATWTLSSGKAGNGVVQLRDGSTETFWQSDGPQPHYINIQFSRKVGVSQLRMHLSHKADESYTPSRLSIRIGTSHHDCEEIQIVELNEPEGWITIYLAKPVADRYCAHKRGRVLQVLGGSEARRGLEPGGTTSLRAEMCKHVDPDCGGAIDFVRTHFVQICVQENHQNGRDTHVRQVQLFGPRVDRGAPQWDPEPAPQADAFLPFLSVR